MVPRWAKSCRKRRPQGPLGTEQRLSVKSGSMDPGGAASGKGPFPLLGIGSRVFCASSVLSNNGCIETRVSPDSRYLLGETGSIFMWLLAATPFNYTSFVLLHGPAFQWEILIE